MTQQNYDKLTHKDIARLVGVGTSTVSRVLNDSNRVAPETREKILSVIKSTGYKPSSAARMLVRKKHETIGLVFEREHVNTFYGAGLIEGVSDELSATGNRLAMGMIKWHSPAVEIENLPLLRTSSVDGLILDLAQIGGDLDMVVAQLRLPYVYVNPSGSRPFNTIMPDDVNAAETATQYLIDRGHKRIGYIPCYKNSTHSSQTDRMRGYVETLLRANLQPIPLWDKPLDDIYSEEDDFMKRISIYREQFGCTGIVGYSSIEIVRSLFACYRFNLKVPQDMALIGCDYNPMLSEVPVSLPTINMDRAKMGRIAVRMLMERIKCSGSNIPTVLFKGTLVEDCRDWYSARGLGIDVAADDGHSK